LFLGNVECHLPDYTERNTNINCYSGIHYWHVCMTL